jgi:hypothetical protein
MRPVYAVLAVTIGIREEVNWPSGVGRPRGLRISTLADPVTTILDAVEWASELLIQEVSDLLVSSDLVILVTVDSTSREFIVSPEAGDQVSHAADSSTIVAYLLKLVELIC